MIRLLSLSGRTHSEEALWKGRGASRLPREDGGSRAASPGLLFKQVGAQAKPIRRSPAPAAAGRSRSPAGGFLSQLHLLGTPGMTEMPRLPGNTPPARLGGAPGTTLQDHCTGSPLATLGPGGRVLCAARRQDACAHLVAPSLGRTGF